MEDWVGQGCIFSLAVAVTNSSEEYGQMATNKLAFLPSSPVALSMMETLSPARVVAHAPPEDFLPADDGIIKDFSITQNFTL